MKSVKNILSIAMMVISFITVIHAEEQISFDLAGTLEKAKNNNKQGLYDLAVLKQNGMYGVEKDLKGAIELYKRASALGHRSANHNLGLIYYKGEGVAVNYPEAAKWFSIAADRKVEDSQRNLLRMYYLKEVPRNEKKVEEILIDLAEKGQQKDIESLADYYYIDLDNMILAEQPTLLLAEKGVLKYQSRIAMIYLKSNIQNPDYVKAYNWFLKAAGRGDYKSKIGLASLYYGGLGVEKNQAESLKWFKSACRQNPVETFKIFKEIASKNDLQIPECE
jgi:TPR repeat protein